MNFFLNKLSAIIPTTNIALTSNKGNQRVAFKEEKDVFIKSAATQPTFTSRKKGSTVKGNDLKDLDNIVCPYSGVKMISGRKMDKIEEKLKKCSTLKQEIEVLKPYKNCMQKTEKQMYLIFKNYADANPNATVNDCLNELKPECLAELRIEEFKVLDKVDKVSYKLDAKTALEIRKITTNARNIILSDKQEQIFKRKDLLSQLYNVSQNHNDKHINEMWEIANKLPRSANNINAFVVKYANRDSNEICSRLLRPSVASIEHITPASKKGDDSLSNFMLVSRDWNSDRGNIPLDVYIRRHPNIPKYTQLYADGIIKAINAGKLENNEWYPYVLKEKLFDESKGLINIDLSNYDIPESEAMLDAPDNVNELYNALKTKNTSKRRY